MKHAILLLIVISLLPASSFSSWMQIPLDQLVQDSDLIVVGTLNGVFEHSKEGTDYGEGTIDIEEVIWGHWTPDQPVILKWQNPSTRACPRVEHRGNENKSGIWLLTIDEGGVVRANYPGRFLELSERARVETFLHQKKVCTRANKKVVTMSEPINVSVVFRNPSQNQIQFPGLEYMDGYLYLSPGIKLLINKGFGDKAKQVSLLASRVFVSKDLPPITLGPGQEHRTVIDLSELLDIEPAESYTLSVNVKGHGVCNEFGFYTKPAE